MDVSSLKSSGYQPLARERGRVDVVIEAEGRMGIAFTIDPATCMAVLKADPNPEGSVERENEGMLREGDRLDSLNGAPFANISAFDSDGDGKIDIEELCEAVRSANLREVYARRPGSVDVTDKSDAEVAALILKEFDADGSGELDGAEVSAFLQMVLDSVVATIAGASRPLALSFSRPPEWISTADLLVLPVTVSAAGPLGVQLSIDPGTCMARLQNDPSAAGMIVKENPGVLRAGDRLEAVNTKPFAPVTAFDSDGDGKIDLDELTAAVKSGGLRAIWGARPGVGDISSLPDADVAARILEEFDADKSGELDGAEVSAFLQMMLNSTIARLVKTPRPFTLVFSRSTRVPEPAPEQPGPKPVAAAAAAAAARPTAVRPTLTAAAAAAGIAAESSVLLSLAATHDMVARLLVKRAEAHAAKFGNASLAVRAHAVVITWAVHLLQRRCVRLAMELSVEEARQTNPVEDAAFKHHYTMVIRDGAGLSDKLGIFTHVAVEGQDIGRYLIDKLLPTGAVAKQYGDRCRVNDSLLALNGVRTTGRNIDQVFAALRFAGRPLVMKLARRTFEVETGDATTAPGLPPAAAPAPVANGALAAVVEEQQPAEQPVGAASADAGAAASTAVSVPPTAAAALVSAGGASGSPSRRVVVKAASVVENAPLLGSIECSPLTGSPSRDQRGVRLCGSRTGSAPGAAGQPTANASSTRAWRQDIAWFSRGGSVRRRVQWFSALQQSTAGGVSGAAAGMTSPPRLAGFAAAVLAAEAGLRRVVAELEVELGPYRSARVVAAARMDPGSPLLPRALAEALGAHTLAVGAYREASAPRDETKSVGADEGEASAVEDPLEGAKVAAAQRRAWVADETYAILTSELEATTALLESPAGASRAALNTELDGVASAVRDLSIVLGAR